MLLEGAYRAFGGVATVIVWGNKLEINVTQFHAPFHFLGGFIVKSL